MVTGQVMPQKTHLFFLFVHHVSMLANKKYVFLNMYIASTDSYMHIKEDILLPGAHAALLQFGNSGIGDSNDGDRWQASTTQKPLTLCRRSHPAIHTKGDEGR